MKNLRFLAVLLLMSALSYAQQPSRCTIKGIIKDAEGHEAAFATVMLLSPVDSTLKNFTQSNDKGAFSFNNVKNTDYVLKVSHISFLPLQMHVSPSATALHDMGMVLIKPIAKELFEVVIKTAKAPLIIHGDTIEYDATTFKIPPGSSVEDLLRRLPGIEVDLSGNLKTQGKDVKRVYVDGKTFFGDDPKGATKNLDANVVSKVQVFDEKSEQAKLTGVDDGVKEKAMNLELKDEFKKGSFGKITLAGGEFNDKADRYAARGSYNRFNKTQQLSFIGYMNNINETGVNWEDYSEFKGQSGFSQYDNGDFGFSSGNNYFDYGDDSSPYNSYDGRGFSKNIGGGINYNFDNSKTKINASYFFKHNDIYYTQTGYKETFYADTSFFNNDTTSNEDVKNNHTLALRVEQNIDSNNIIIAKANFRYSTTGNTYLNHNLYSASEQENLNTIFTDNTSDNTSWKLTSAAIYRHKFRKKGRSFALSAGYNRNPGDNEATYFSLNDFLSLSYSEQLKRIAAKNIEKEQIKSSVLYTEPLSKKFFWELFYNFNSSSNQVNNQVKDAFNSNIRIDSLSVYYSNKVLYNRLGTDIRYNFNGLNIMMGIAGQNLQLDGKYSIDKGMPLISDPINKEYWSLTPKTSISYEFRNNMWFDFNYNYNISEPSFEYLQPTPNISNPLYRVVGNINLSPERTHHFDLSYNYYNPASFSNVGINGGYELCENRITYNQYINWEDSLGMVSISKPDNNSKYTNFYTYLWSSFPIVKTVLTSSWSLNYSYNTSGSFINDVFNESRQKYYSISGSFSLTLGQKLLFSIKGSGNFNDRKLSLQNNQNQFIQSYTAGASIKWQFAGKFFLESNYDYNLYKNSQYDYEKDFPILNASVRKIIGKNNRFEVRLAAFDVFNKRLYIYQYSNPNYYSRTTSPTLSRYFMLSVSYNIKGFENKIKKPGYW
ncbi:MAG: outer membrane beta-barrel protein [Bacteroidota bacterium]